jgi:hypothetical protein
MLAALEFRDPGKIPVIYHPSAYPVADWAMADDYRFPPLPAGSGLDFDQACAAVQRQKEQFEL